LRFVTHFIGAFGTVYKADFFGIDVAVKQICPQEVKDPMEEIFVQREIAVLKYIFHYFSLFFIIFTCNNIGVVDIQI
jgi:hypothetical protein